MRLLDQRQTAGEARASYRTVLRAVGHYLDAQHARDAQVLELPGQLVLQFTEVEAGMNRQVVYLPLADLHASGRILEQSGWHPGRRVRKATGRGGHEAILGALGAALDQADAEMMALEELDDGGVLLTYHLYVPHAGYVPRKQHMVLGRDAQQLLVKSAAGLQGAGRRGPFGVRAR